MQTETFYYLELCKAAPEQPHGEPFAVTVGELAELWHCSPRYAKQLIRRLSGGGWISWLAGLGRGHSSRLALLVDGIDVLLREARLCMDQGRPAEAMELMTRYGSREAREGFRDWMSERMGFKTQAGDGGQQDTLLFPVYRPIFTLDPAQVYYAFDSHLSAEIFDTLVEYDSRTQEVRPGLAHSWESGSDGRSWVFYLRKGVMFHHGRELNAGDVVFTLGRFLNRPDEFEASWMFRHIEVLEALGPYTVHIRLKEPNYLFLRFLGTVSAGIVPVEKARKDEAAFALHPCGTGPFRVAERTRDRCVLEAFGQHFRGRPQLDRVEILILRSVENGYFREPEWTAVMSSHGDATGERRQAVEQGAGEWVDVETLFTCCTVMVFNCGKSGPQQSSAFRHALHLLIDRKRMIDELGADLIHPAAGFHYRPGSDEESSEEAALPERDIAKLLLQSGYRGEPFRLAVNTFHQADAEWISSRAAEYGIRMELDVSDWNGTVNQAYDADVHDARIFGTVLAGDEVAEIQLYMQPNYLQPAFDPATAVAVEEQVRAILREPGQQHRRSGLAGLEALMKSGDHILFLVHKKNNTSHHRTVRGVEINAYGWPPFHQIWLQPVLQIDN
ncbi:ABC transporter substrate-binding protein [Paenibacillus tepidiphilus]|uniref:ABC transporter substrate-binding protein n=1 Tax=Paenibacillus tepidiphilus TaxID=2608683 RepID=UPI001EF0E6F5|nr:ABC transporter substrate-binding protein [Paenibacillus tepidiphilus]